MAEALLHGYIFVFACDSGVVHHDFIKMHISLAHTQYYICDIWVCRRFRRRAPGQIKPTNLLQQILIYLAQNWC